MRGYSQRPIPICACVHGHRAGMAGEVSDHCIYRVYFHSHVGIQGEPCLLGTNLVVPLGLTVPGEGVEPCEGDLS